MCGNAFEALIGAIYLDRGYRACKKFMEERIISQYLNLEKISRKEVNFKSKLIEWSQKNKFEIEFNLLDQSVDKEQNPVFETQIVVEHIPAGLGKGYSKKESQQEAAHETLNKIKSDPQFIDAIFAAKAQREQAAEAPAVSEKEPEVAQEVAQAEEIIQSTPVETESKDMDKLDETERIIAQAEEAAFQETTEEDKATSIQS